MLLRMTKWPLIALALVACSRRPAPVIDITERSAREILRVRR